MIADPYVDVCAHGLLPLVLDSDSGRLRFAVIGTENPGDCLSSASQLPQDATVSIMAFPSDEVLRSWVAGATRFLGNAVSISRPEQTAFHCVLIVDHSSSGSTAGSLDEAVAAGYGISGDPVHDSVKRAYADLRRSILAGNQRKRSSDAYFVRWKGELATAAEHGFSYSYARGNVTFADDEPLYLETSPFGGKRQTQLSIGKTLAGYQISWTMPRNWHSHKNLSALSAFVTEQGGALSPEWTVRFDISSFDDETIKTVMGKIEAIWATEVALEGSHDRIRRVRNLQANEKMMAVVRQAYGHGIICLPDLHRPGWQLNPETGTISTAAVSYVRQALNAGLLQIIHQGSHERMTVQRPGILAITAAGRAVVEDELDIAASLLREHKGNDLMFLKTDPADGFNASLKAVTELMPEFDKAALLAKVEKRYGKEIGLISLPPGDNKRWAMWAALTALGPYWLTPDGRFLNRRPG